MNDLRITTHTGVYVIDQITKTLTRYSIIEGLNAFEVSRLAERKREWRLDHVKQLVVGEPALFAVWTLDEPYKSQWRRTSPVVSIVEIVERWAEAP